MYVYNHLDVITGVVSFGFMRVNACFSKCLFSQFLGIFRQCGYKEC